MKYLTLILFALAIVVFAGCEAQNPVCTHNFCFVGEAFPRSELEAGQPFDEVDIDDSIIFTKIITWETPIPRPATQEKQPDSGTLADIVADVAAGNKTYAGKMVTITATVTRDVSTFNNRDAIALNTNNEDVVFFVSSDGNPKLLENYKVDESYTFDLFVLNITDPDPDFPQHGIFAGYSTARISASINTVVADVAAGGRSYISKIVSLTGIVESPAEVFIDTSDTISLLTNNTKVIFFVSNWTASPNIMAKYKKGSSYDFDVFIRTIDKRGDNYYVQSYIVLD